MKILHGEPVTDHSVSAMKILVTDQSGQEHELEGLDGWRAMEVIRDWGLNIKAECGGACSCATCHVYVDEAWFERLRPPSDDEEDLLYSTLDKKPTSRLSCQILLNDDLDGLKAHAWPPAPPRTPRLPRPRRWCGRRSGGPQ
jgi:2Fe-2S ferredoxin